MIGLKCLVLVSLVLGADFKILTGTVDTFENFHFLARFCFRPHNGKASFTFTYRRENVDNILPTYNSLLMYYDGTKQWDAAYKTAMTCHEKVDLLEDQNDSDQIAELRETDEMYCTQEDNTAPLINCTSNFENKEAVYAVGDPNIVTFHNGYIGFQNSRARWWYFAVSNCDNPNGVTRMSYTVELTNGNTFWTRHVSADEIGILETDIVFVILFIYLVIASAKVARTLANRQLYHTSFKIFMASVTMQAISQVVVVIFRCMINMNGEENKVLKYFGKAVAVIAETLFILLLILLSKGWTVVRGRLSTQGTMILSASITFYFLSQVVALFWSAYMFDPGEVLYEYESAPGYVVIACLTLMWIWFCTCNYHTLQNYPDQNKFYGIFFAAYSIWFLAKPIMVLIAAFQLEDHYREKAVNVVLNSNHFFGYSVFLVLTRPSTNNKMFPYNVKTSQIGVSGTADDLVDGERPKASSFERANMFRAARTDSMTFRYAVLIFVVLQLGQLSAELSRIKVRQDGHYVDNQGRVRIFHGFNAVNKAFPWYPQHMSNASLVKHYKEWGFNAVRLGTMWSGVEPEQGKYNETYLQVIRSQLSLLADNGMHAFLDMHQDVLSKRFGTYDGAPAWLVDILPKGRNPYPYPWKSTKPFSGGNWALQYLTEECGVAYQGLYDNVNHSQDMFIAFWKKVASTFKDVTSVLGYELINEPWAGDVWADPLLFLPKNPGSQNLFPMYDKIARAIRDVDNDTIIMYEPVTWGIWFNGESGTGFETVPGGPEFRDRSALSYHLYCWVKSGDSDPLSFFDKVLCDDLLAADVLSNAKKEFTRTGGGGFLTEFGECKPDGKQNSSNTVLCETVLKLADENLVSWTYWDTDFFDSSGNVQLDIVKPFIRAYPRATAGTPLSLSWDMKSHSMMFSFLLDPTIMAPTEIFVPPIYFGEGIEVAISDTLVYTWDRAMNHVMLVYPKINSVTNPVEAKVYLTPKFS